MKGPPIGRRLRHLPLLLVAMVVAPVAACDRGLNGADSAKAQEQAAAALDQWANAVAAAGGPPLVIPVGDLTGQIGDWEVAVGSSYKIALMAGRIFTMSPLPGDAQQDVEVRWEDGTTANVPVMSAQDAIVAISNAAMAPCDGCTDLVATEATLISGPIQTSRGPAIGPMWSFTVQGTAVKVTRVPIANSLTVPPLAWNPSSSVGVHLDAAAGTLSGRGLTVAFVGAPDTGDKPCGEDYTAEAIESNLAVVVVVIRHPHLNLVGGCSAVGARRTATAMLANPLGDRVVLNLDGQPVPTTVSP